LDTPKRKGNHKASKRITKKQEQKLIQDTEEVDKEIEKMHISPDPSLEVAITDEIHMIDVL